MDLAAPGPDYDSGSGLIDVVAAYDHLLAVTAGQPVAAANGPYSGTAGSPIQFTSSSSQANGGTIISYQWDFGDGGTSTVADPTHTYAASGLYAVRLTVTDSEGLSSQPSLTTASVAAANQPPTANANGPYSGKVGFPIAFSGAGSFDPEGDPLTFLWSFGDGGVGSGVAPSHAYASAGDHAVTLTVNDGQLDSAPSVATAHVTVNGQPVAVPGGPYVQTGLTVSFDGAGSYDPDNLDADPTNDDALTYTWSFGDGTTGTGATPVHTYPTAATYAVTLTVSDGYTSSAPGGTTATVGESPSMHVGDLDGASARVAGNRWRATVTITVHDAQHAALSSVVVNGQWSGGDGDGRTVTCTTDASGQCSMTSGRLSRKADPSVVFTTTALSGAGAAYLPSSNHDPDAGPQASDGTRILIPGS